MNMKMENIKNKVQQKF